MNFNTQYTCHSFLRKNIRSYRNWIAAMKLKTITIILQRAKPTPKMGEISKSWGKSSYEGARLAIKDQVSPPPHPIAYQPYDIRYGQRVNSCCIKGINVQEFTFTSIPTLLHPTPPPILHKNTVMEHYKSDILRVCPIRSQPNLHHIITNSYSNHWRYFLPLPLCPTHQSLPHQNSKWGPMWFCELRGDNAYQIMKLSEELLTK